MVRLHLLHMQPVIGIVVPHAVGWSTEYDGTVTFEI